MATTEREQSPLEALVEIHTQPDPAHAETRRWRFVAAYEHARTDLIGASILILALFLLLRAHADPVVMLAWSVVLLCLAWVRVEVRRRALSRGPDSGQRPGDQLLERAFALSVAGDGLMMTIGFFLFLPDAAVVERAVYLLFMAGICAWVTTAYASVLEAVLGFQLVMLLPLIVGLLTSGQPLWQFVAVGCIAFVYAMAMVAIRNSALLLTGHVTGIRNRRLAAELAQEKRAVEALNRELEADIAAREAVEAELRQSRNEAQQLARELEDLTWIDSLTSIANRRQLDRALEREWVRAARAGEPLALIMADVDSFKQYNDRYGHQAGDACLRRFASLLKAASRRGGDLPARYGGEEFALLLPNTDTQSAVAIAELTRTSLEALGLPHETAAAGQILTASFGVAALMPNVHGSPHDLVAAADRALYAAKNCGRNAVRTHSAEAIPVTH